MPFDWNLPNLAQPPTTDSKQQRPYGPTSIRLALHSLDTYYNHQKVLQLCVDHGNWKAAAEVCEMDLDYTQALDYRLQEFAATMEDEKKEKSAEEAVVLINKYIK